MEPVYRFTYNVPIIKAMIQAHGMEYVINRFTESVTETLLDINKIEDPEKHWHQTDGMNSMQSLSEFKSRIYHD